MEIDRRSVFKYKQPGLAVLTASCGKDAKLIIRSKKIVRILKKGQ